MKQNNMPLSKGAIAGIVIASILVVGVGIWAGVMYGSPKKTPPTPNANPGYNCDPVKACQPAPSGTTGKFATLQDCQASTGCQPYQCNNMRGTCDQSSATYQVNSACQSGCQVLYGQGYNCDATKGCVQAPPKTVGAYATLQQCQSQTACQKLKCNPGTNKCDTPSDTFQDVTACSNTCSPKEGTGFNCDPTNQCVAAPAGGKYQYATKALCEASTACQKVACNSQTGTCDAASTYADSTACSNSCQNLSYVCDVSNGCQPAPVGQTGPYNSFTACDSACKKLGCGTLGTCTALSSTWGDVNTCAKSCQNQTYDCDSASGCKQAAIGVQGSYQSQGDCTGACKQLGCGTLGNCNVTTTSWSDENTCAKNCVNQTYNCDSQKGCITAPLGVKGSYSSQGDCTKTGACEQKSCDPSLGLCSATSTTWQDGTTCAGSCTNTYYLCDSGTGCTKAPQGVQGLYPNSGACAAACLQKGCDSTGTSGGCTATTGVYQDQSACKAQCNIDVSFNCNSASKQCEQVSGSSGAYPDCTTCETNCK